MAINPYYSRVLEVFSTGKASRPSTAARKMYPDVSRAYFETVNEVLSRRKNASQAAADLQKELTRILKTDATGAEAALERKPAAASP